MVLITCHGIGPKGVHGPRYADLFAERLQAELGEPVIHRPVYWADVIDYHGLGTPLAGIIDTLLDPLRYTWSWRKRREIAHRLHAAIIGLPARTEERMVVSHSWGGVIVHNELPPDRVRLWVSSSTRDYWPTWGHEPPRVSRWVNIWSKWDPLSEPWDSTKNPVENIQDGAWAFHPGMWSDQRRIPLIAQLWKGTR